MLRSGKVWQIWRFAIFLSISLPLSRNLTPSLSYHIVRKRIAKVTDFLSFCPFGISIFPFLTIGISMYQKSILPYFIIPYLFTPSFFPFGAFRSVFPFLLTPRYLSSFFFPLSARGPTRRRNSTGLAKQWGGWPIEQANRGCARSQLLIGKIENRQNLHAFNFWPVEYLTGKKSKSQTGFAILKLIYKFSSV